MFQFELMTTTLSEWYKKIRQKWLVKMSKFIWRKKTTTSTNISLLSLQKTERSRKLKSANKFFPLVVFALSFEAEQKHRPQFVVFCGKKKELTRLKVRTMILKISFVLQCLLASTLKRYNCFSQFVNGNSYSMKSKKSFFLNVHLRKWYASFFSALTTLD